MVVKIEHSSLFMGNSTDNEKNLAFRLSDYFQPIVPLPATVALLIYAE
jgi:hypothetical protein